MRYAMALLFFVALGTEAQWTRPGATEPSSDSASRKHANGTGAMLTLTGNPEAFLEEWHSTAHEHVPRLISASTVRRGGAIFALVFFEGCAEEGKPCGATIDFKVLGPDGST